MIPSPFSGLISHYVTISLSLSRSRALSHRVAEIGGETKQVFAFKISIEIYLKWVKQILVSFMVVSSLPARSYTWRPLDVATCRECGESGERLSETCANRHIYFAVGTMLGLLVRDIWFCLQNFMLFFANALDFGFSLA